MVLRNLSNLPEHFSLPEIAFLDDLIASKVVPSIGDGI